jgi:hypothetical protein
MVGTSIKVAHVVDGIYLCVSLFVQTSCYSLNPISVGSSFATSALSIVYFADTAFGDGRPP